MKITGSWAKANFLPKTISGGFWGEAASQPNILASSESIAGWDAPANCCVGWVTYKWLHEGLSIDKILKSLTVSFHEIFLQLVGLVIFGCSVFWLGIMVRIILGGLIFWGWGFAFVLSFGFWAKTQIQWNAIRIRCHVLTWKFKLN